MHISGFVIERLSRWKTTQKIIFGADFAIVRNDLVANLERCVKGRRENPSPQKHKKRKRNKEKMNVSWKKTRIFIKGKVYCKQQRFWKTDGACFSTLSETSDEFLHRTLQMVFLSSFRFQVGESHFQNCQLHVFRIDISVSREYGAPFIPITTFLRVPL